MVYSMRAFATGPWWFCVLL